MTKIGDRSKPSLVAGISFLTGDNKGSVKLYINPFSLEFIFIGIQDKSILAIIKYCINSNVQKIIVFISVNLFLQIL